MNKEEMFALMNANPGFHLATVEGDQPRCRAMFLFRADENGIIFHTHAKKMVSRQIDQNPKVELCFNDFKKGIQVRVTGKLEVVEDKALKDEIVEHPTRKFIKTWRDSGSLEDFKNNFRVYRLKGGKAVWWSAETNSAPKTEITL